MIFSRLPATCWFICAIRVWPRASAAEMISSVVACWARCWGRNSAVVTKSGQVRQALACGQVLASGSPQKPFGRAWVARPRRCLAQAASASGPSGSRVTVCPWALTLAGPLPVAADRGIGKPRIVGGHLRRGVVQDPADHVLGDVLVDQPGAQ